MVLPSWYNISTFVKAEFRGGFLQYSAKNTVSNNFSESYRCDRIPCWIDLTERSAARPNYYFNLESRARRHVEKILRDLSNVTFVFLFLFYCRWRKKLFIWTFVWDLKCTMGLWHLYGHSGTSTEYERRFTSRCPEVFKQTYISHNSHFVSCNPTIK